MEPKINEFKFQYDNTLRDESQLNKLKNNTIFKFQSIELWKKLDEHPL